MWKATLRALALTIGGLTATYPALPQQQQQELQCGTHEQLSQTLGKNFNEERTGLGLIGEGALIEMYVSDGGSWTILMTRTDGTSCIIAAGHSWESVPMLVGQHV